VTETSDDILQFAAQFRNAVIARAHGNVGEGSSDEAAFREEAFTELFIDALAETGAVTEGHVCHFDRRIGHSQARVDGYYFDEEDEDRLDLFISIYDGGETPSAVVRDDVIRAITRVLKFVETAVGGVHEKMEPSDEAFSMLQRIHELRTHIKELRIFVLTDGLAKEFKGSKGLKLKGMHHTVHVWDIERLSRCVAAGGAKEPIEVDFIKEFGHAIRCLPVEVEGAGYKSYLLVLTGPVLHKLYDDYGERLLELNVRSFLQARGKINGAIRKTILDEPRQFFAFNNGLTAIAESVRTRRLEDGGIGIAWVRGLQIVNGGQTTASIHRAAKKDGALEQLKTVFVQAKLSVVDEGLLEEMVPRISLYANSQNKVNEADFSANDPYHRQLERLSRSIWTPDGQTHWFYERARGQFQVARARDGKTPASLKKFDALNPSHQVFTKTDLAAFEHSWGQLPHLVSRGSQKNFREFTIRLSQRAAPALPDENHYKELIARGIVYKHAQTAAREAKIGAYRANIVTYVVAYLAKRAGDIIDLRQIWDRQAVITAIDTAIQNLLGPVGDLIVRGAGTRNVTEYAKREECWKFIASHDLELGAELSAMKGPRRPPTSRPASMRDIAAAVEVAAEKGVEYIDHTESGGALWLVADQSHKELAKRLEHLGFDPIFAPGGGKATGGRPA
jgi:hypothetical protein